MREWLRQRRKLGQCTGCAKPLEDRTQAKCQPCKDTQLLRQIRRQTGLPADDIWARLPGRYGNCEICGKSGAGSRFGVLDFDHCHATGKFRGWLCHNCNRVLGMVQDSVPLLNALAAYLNRN